MSTNFAVGDVVIIETIHGELEATVIEVNGSLVTVRYRAFFDDMPPGWWMFNAERPLHPVRRKEEADEPPNAPIV